MSAAKKRHALYGVALVVATAFDLISGAASASAFVGLAVNILWLAEV